MYLNLEYNFINYMTNNVKLYVVFFVALCPCYTGLETS